MKRKKKSLIFNHGELLRYPDKEGYELTATLSVHNYWSVRYGKKPTKKQLQKDIDCLYGLLESSLKLELNEEN